MIPDIHIKNRQKSFGLGRIWNGLDKDGKTTNTLNSKGTGIIPEP